MMQKKIKKILIIIATACMVLACDRFFVHWVLVNESGNDVYLYHYEVSKHKFDSDCDIDCVERTVIDRINEEWFKNRFTWYIKRNPNDNLLKAGEEYQSGGTSPYSRSWYQGFYDVLVFFTPEQVEKMYNCDGTSETEYDKIMILEVDDIERANFRIIYK